MSEKKIRSIKPNDVNSAELTQKEEEKEEHSLKVSVIRFAGILRSLGVRLGTSEVIDAFYALDEVDLRDRETFKYSLKCNFLKDKEKEDVFEEAFEYFFQPPELKSRRQEERRAKKEEVEAQIEEATEDLQFKDEPLDLDEEQKLTYANMEEKYKEQLKKILEDTEEGKKVDENFRPVIEEMVRSSLNRWEEHLKDNLPTDMIQDTGNEELDIIKDQVRDGAGTKSTSSASVSQKDLKELSDKDLPRAKKAMQAMIKKLMNRISRKYKSTKKAEKLDMRKTIRKNISHGGTLFNLSYKRRRKSKPSLMVICDVSGSMARYTSFLLQFIYGLGSAVRKIEGFIFSEDLERITDRLKNNNNFEKSMAELVNESEEWGKSTDLGTSLRTLEEKWEYLLKPHTTVIILSDGKSSGLKRARAEIYKLQRKVKDIIWLNPVPADEWEDMPQIEGFRQYAKMFECNTIEDLEKVLKREVFSV